VSLAALPSMFMLSLESWTELLEWVANSRTPLCISDKLFAFPSSGRSNSCCNSYLHDFCKLVAFNSI